MHALGAGGGRREHAFIVTRAGPGAPRGLPRAPFRFRIQLLKSILITQIVSSCSFWFGSELCCFVFLGGFWHGSLEAGYLL